MAAVFLWARVATIKVAGAGGHSGENGRYDFFPGLGICHCAFTARTQCARMQVHLLGPTSSVDARQYLLEEEQRGEDEIVHNVAELMQVSAAPCTGLTASCRAEGGGYCCRPLMRGLPPS